MKRITKIELENYRVFFDKYKIKIPNGENLLIYGENGSGKSSIFKAIKNYLESSRDATLKFTKNIYKSETDLGKIEISFSDLDPINQTLIDNSEQTLYFGSEISTHNVLFVQNGDLIKGFLDYRNLLSVYNHNEPIPNLFHLIVTNLLFNHYPIGGTEPIGKKYLRLKNELLSVRTRRELKHRNALIELPVLQTELEETLKRIFSRVNLLLKTYFKNNLKVDFVLLPTVFKYGPENWHIQSDLRLTLKLNHVLITDHREVLNEARLSAMAICIYLASLLENPQLGFELKILFLDDVFIGLDTGNRFPITNILNTEFKTYQIFFSTYDRQWYELAQRYFNSHAPEKWRSIELYTTSKTTTTTTFDIPILLPYEDNFDKAVHYLHHRFKPDYPAAANYFRKFAEEILKTHIPSHEIRNVNSVLIETHRLGELVNSGIHFLTKIGANISFLIQLKNTLPSLLHPLSHYDLTAPVYRNELEEVQNLLPFLEKQLRNLKQALKIFIPSGRMFNLIFKISTDETGCYELYSKETIYALKDTAGNISISIGNCHCKTCYVINNGVEISRHNFHTTDKKVQYSSIENAYDTIYNHIHSISIYSHIPRVTNYLTEFTYKNETGLHSLEKYKSLLLFN